MRNVGISGLRGRHLPGLQALRAIAALCVLVHHSVFYAAVSSSTKIDYFMSLNLGGIGVYMFFALSGAAMVLASEQSAASFAAKRILRIYPPYVVALILATLILLPIGAYPNLWGDFSLVLFPTGGANSSFFVPYWTLTYEMFFYCLLWVLIGIAPRPWHSKILLGWAALIAITHPFVPPFPSVTPNFWQIFVSPLCIYFVAGYLAGKALRTGQAADLACLAVIIALGSMLGLADFGQVAVFNLLSCSAIYLFAGLTPVDQLSKGLVWIGDRSYGLYLLHLPVCWLIFKLMQDSGLSIWVGTAVIFTISGLVGLAYGHLEFVVHGHRQAILERIFRKPPSPAKIPLVNSPS